MTSPVLPPVSADSGSPKSVRPELVEGHLSAEGRPSTSSGRTEAGNAFPNPVPLRPRHDGWTPARQAAFLRALAEAGNIRAACKSVGMSRRSAYDLKRRALSDPAGALPFARAWDAALIHARDAYQEALLEKGLNGWTEKVWYHGEEVGERERFHPGLFLAALKRLDVKADGLDREGNPGRVAAGHFDALVEAIEGGADASLLIAEQDAAAAPKPEIQRPPRSGSQRAIAEQRAYDVGRALIVSQDPEDIDISDLDLERVEEWDDLQWLRAEHSGLLERIGYYAQYADEDPDEDGYDEAGDAYDDPDDEAAPDGARPPHLRVVEPGGDAAKGDAEKRDAAQGDAGKGDALTDLIDAYNRDMEECARAEREARESGKGDRGIADAKHSDCGNDDGAYAGSESAAELGARDAGENQEADWRKAPRGRNGFRKLPPHISTH